MYTNENDAVIQLSYTTDTKSTLFVDGADYLEKPVTVNGCAGTIYLSQNEEETNSIITGIIKEVNENSNADK